MPQIATATIGVDLDGKRIPAEAEALAREAGALAGDGFNNELDKGLSKGGANRKRTLGQQFKDLSLLARTSAKEAGSAFSSEFDKAGQDIRRNLTGAFGVVSQISQALHGQGQAIADGFRNAADRVGEFGTRIKAAGSDVRTLADDVGTRVTAGLSRARTAVDNFGTRVVNAFKKFDDPTLGARIGNAVVVGLTSAAASVEQFGRDFGTVFKSLPSIGEAAFGNLRLKLVGALNGRTLGAQLGDGIVTGLTKAAFDIEQRFKSVPTNIAAAFGNLRLKLLGAVNGRTIGTQIGDAIVGGLTLAAFKVERVATAMGVAFSRFRISAADEVSRFVTAADVFFGRLVTGVAGVARSIGTSLTVAFSNLRLRGAEVFSALATGLDTLVRGVPVLARALGSGLVSGIDTFGRRVDSVVPRLLSGFLGVGGAAVKMGEAVAKGAGDAAIETEKAASAIGGSLGKVAGAFKGFDPFDNFGSAVIAILALLPPLAVLASAAAAGLVILGSAFTSALVGAGAFYILLEGILRLDSAGIAKLGGNAAVAAKGFQAFFGTFEKSKFVPGQIDQIRVALERTFLGAVGPAVDRLSTVLLPHLVTDFGLVGTALGKVFTAFATGLTTPQGLKDIDLFFQDIAKQLPIIGRIVGNLGSIFVNLFTAANGPATDFLKTIDQMTGDFAKFLSTPQGKNAVQKWLADMQVVLQAVGTFAGDAYQAIQDLASKPANIDTTIASIKNLSDGVKSIADSTNSIAKLAEALTKIIAVIGSVADAFTNLDSVLTGVAYTIAAVLVQATNNLAAFGKVVGDVATLTADELSGNFVAAAKDAKQLGVDFKAAFTGDKGLVLTTAQVRDMATALEQSGAAAGKSGKDLSTFISLLGGVPPEVKTQIILDALKAGQDINDFSAALLVLPKSSQVKIITDAAAAGKDVSGLVSVIKGLPTQAKFQIIDNVAQAGGDLTKFAGLLKGLPASRQVQIITDAIAAGIPVSKLSTLLKGLPADQQVHILTTAAAAGVPVASLKGLIDGLKDKLVKVGADTAEGKTIVSSFQSLINSIKQNKIPGITANTKDGQSLIKLLQAAIDALKQKKQPPVDIDPRAGLGHIKALQINLDAFKQGTPPKVDIDNAPGLTDTKNLQTAVNNLRQGTRPPVDINNGPGLTSSNNLQTAINRIRQGALPRVGVDPQPGITGAGQVQAAINRITGKSVTVSVSYVTTNSPPPGTTINAHSGAFINNGVKAFASGGLNGRDGMIAAGGANILWAEPQTGWEAYISGAAGQSARNIAVWMEAGRRLGIGDSMGGRQVTVAPGAITIVTPSADPAQVAAAVVDRLVPSL